MRKAQATTDERMQTLKVGVGNNRNNETVAAQMSDYSYSQGTETAEVTGNHSYSVSLPENQHTEQTLCALCAGSCWWVNCEHLPDDSPIGNQSGT